MKIDLSAMSVLTIVVTVAPSISPQHIYADFLVYDNTRNPIGPFLATSGSDASGKAGMRA
jgi:hypothetical protein